MTKRLVKIVSLPIALSLTAAACGSDEPAAEETPATEAPAEAPAEEPATTEAHSGDDFGGAVVTITGPERTDQDVGSINDTLNAWGETVNLTVEYLGDADWEANINTQVEGGNPPNISIFPQPGKLADFVAAGHIKALAPNADASVDEFWLPGFQLNGAVDGVQYGVPTKTDLKSLVWYKPAMFTDNGYEVPATFDEFTALVDTMAGAGGAKPLCVGIESGQATGWPFTDWVEEMVLRQAGADVYDQWVAGEVGFSDPQIQTAMGTVLDLWTEDNVFAIGGSVASTNFGENAQPLVDGECFMHRQANFFAGFFPEGTNFADPSDPEAIDVFYFPDVNGDRPVLTAGTYAAGFDEDPATHAVLAYMATAEYAETRQRLQSEMLGGSLSGFLSAAQGQDPSVYQPLEQSFLDILENAATARFDGSDLMPADVGAGTFWTEGTKLVTGETDLVAAGEAIDASYPG